MLDNVEIKVLQSCSDANENMMLSVKNNGEHYIYRSRFLAVDFNRQYIVIDVPSPETPDAQPMAVNETFEAFFAFKTFRYLIESRVLQHVKFKIQDKEVYALRIHLPGELKDGDKREYFRIPTGMRPPVTVTFTIYKEGGDVPVMSSLIEGMPEEFWGEMVDISGGGFSLRAKLGCPPLPIQSGDVIDARFSLKKGAEQMNIWCDVRNTRKYKGTEILVWGLRFIESSQNKNLRQYRNKIMHYVTERQREMMFK